MLTNENNTKKRKWISCDSDIIIFTPGSNEELRDAVKEWVDNKQIAFLKYGHISEWNTINITDMQDLFKINVLFNDDISNWNVSNVTNMNGMFFSAKKFNIDISRWDVSNVNNMGDMFRCAWSFNKDIGSWNVSPSTHILFMFEFAQEFNQDISKWVSSNSERLLGTPDDIKNRNLMSGINGQHYLMQAMAYSK